MAYHYPRHDQRTHAGVRFIRNGYDCDDRGSYSHGHRGINSYAYNRHTAYQPGCYQSGSHRYGGYAYRSGCYDAYRGVSLYDDCYSGGVTYNRWGTYGNCSVYPRSSYVSFGRPTQYIDQDVRVYSYANDVDYDDAYAGGAVYGGTAYGGESAYQEPVAGTWLPEQDGGQSYATPSAVLPGDAAEPSEDEWLEPLRNGDAAFAIGDYDEARRHYVRAQVDGRYVGEASIAYAMTQFAEGDYAIAALSLRRGLQELPDAIEWPVDVRQLYAGSSALDRHLAALREHVTKNPWDQHAWLVQGYVLWGSGDAVGALGAFEAAVAANPPDVLAQLLRDAAYKAVSDRANATEGQPNPTTEQQSDHPIDTQSSRQTDVQTFAFDPPTQDPMSLRHARPSLVP